MAKHPFLPERMRRVVREAPLLQQATWLLEAGIAAIFFAVCALLPTDRASRFGAAVWRRFGPRLRKTEHVRQNLSLALPERSAAEIEALVPEVWGSWGAMLAELPHLGRITREAESRVQIVMKAEPRVRREPGRAAILVTAHTGNWQIATLAAAMVGMPLTAVYQPDSNPWVDRMVRRFRRALRCRLVERDGSVRELMRELGAGRAIGIVADHRVDEGEPVPLFGIPTLATSVPARLALRFDCELLPIWVERLDGAHFRVTVFEAVTPDDPACDPREQALQMTRKLIAGFESWYRERPEQWVCVTRRWPKQTLAALGERASQT